MKTKQKIIFFTILPLKKNDFLIHFSYHQSSLHLYSIIIIMSTEVLLFGLPACGKTQLIEAIRGNDFKALYRPDKNNKHVTYNDGKRKFLFQDIVVNNYSCFSNWPSIEPSMLEPVRENVSVDDVEFTNNVKNIMKNFMINDVTNITLDYLVISRKILVLFSVDSYQSYNWAKLCVKKIREISKNADIILCASRSDCRRDMYIPTNQQISAKLGVPVFDVSSRTKHNISQLKNML